MGITGYGILRGTRKYVQNQFLEWRMVPKFQKWFRGQTFFISNMVIAESGISKTRRTAYSRAVAGHSIIDFRVDFRNGSLKN